MRYICLAALGAGLLCQSNPLNARNIVITNDDGLTSNVIALYNALKDDGHDVVVSVPCENQSGMGTSLYFAKTLLPLGDPCRNDAAQAGDPGAGEMTRNGLPKGDFFYVNGTPTMALAYGLDILASGRWGKAPDLVLSGPNEGQNVGPIILHSGTVSAVQYAALRNIPAIALSAGIGTADDVNLSNADSPTIARLSADFVNTIDKRSHGAALLPHGLAINVNFPDKLAGAQWVTTRIGTYEAYVMRFAENIALHSTPSLHTPAAKREAGPPQAPGIAIGLSDAAPTTGQENDEGFVVKTNITVSPMQAGYELTTPIDWVGWMASAPSE